MKAVFEMEITNGIWSQKDIFTGKAETTIDEAVAMKNGLMNREWKVVEGTCRKVSELEYLVMYNYEWINEFFNEEDPIVGVFAVGKIDEEVIMEIFDIVNNLDVKNWNDKQITFKINKKIIIVVELVSWFDGIDTVSQWQIVNAYLEKNSKRISYK